MGMFDYVRCKYPLPANAAFAQDMTFQTKDTNAQALDTYEIREDGTLWGEDYDIEDRSDKTFPVGDLRRLMGYMARVNKRPVQEIFTGEVNFYTSLGDDNSGWVELSAYFVNGALQSMNLVSLEQPEA